MQEINWLEGAIALRARKRPHQLLLLLHRYNFTPPKARLSIEFKGEVDIKGGDRAKPE